MNRCVVAISVPDTSADHFISKPEWKINHQICFSAQTSDLCIFGSLHSVVLHDEFFIHLYVVVVVVYLPERMHKRLFSYELFLCRMLKLWAIFLLRYVSYSYPLPFFWILNGAMINQSWRFSVLVCVRCNRCREEWDQSKPTAWNKSWCTVPHPSCPFFITSIVHHNVTVTPEFTWVNFTRFIALHTNFLPCEDQQQQFEDEPGCFCY